MSEASLKTMPKALLLDMDGTLFDSEAVYKARWQASAKAFGIDLNDHVYKQFIGARFAECQQMISELGGPGFNLQKFLIHMGDGGLPVMPLKPGAQALMNWLEQNNITTALVTSSGRETIHSHFAPYGGTSRFQIVVSGDDVIHAKPNPEPYLLACKQLAIAPQNTWAVEDSNPGMYSAISAGCQAIMIPDVLLPHEDVRQNAETILTDLHQLQQKLMVHHQD